MSVTPPSVSVIVPMYNAENWIERCLAPLLAMLGRGEITEIIVVNDGSNDRSQAIVRGLASVQLLAMDEQCGPAAARNCAAQVARGEYLWFVDSDVVVANNAAKVLRETLTRTRPAAVIGSYDDQPGANNFLSQYKNLPPLLPPPQQEPGIIYAACSTTSPFKVGLRSGAGTHPA